MARGGRLIASITQAAMSSGCSILSKASGGGGQGRGLENWSVDIPRKDRAGPDTMVAFFGVDRLR